MGLPRALKNKLNKDMAVMLRASNEAVELFKQYAREAPSYFHGYWEHYYNPRQKNNRYPSTKARFMDNLKYLYRKRTRREHNMNCPAGSFNRKRWRWVNDSPWGYAMLEQHYPRFAEWARLFNHGDWRFNYWPISNVIDKNGAHKIKYAKLPERYVGENYRLQALILAKAFWMSRRRSEIEALMDEHRFKSYSGKRSYTGSLRSYVLQRSKYRCEHCGCREGLAVDHKIPWSKGGRTTIANARVLCKACNIGIYHLEQKHIEVAE